MLTWGALRRRLTATVVLALLIGVTGGVVLAAAAGARRTATAFPRMVAETRSDGVLVSAFGPGLLGLYAELLRRPEIIESGTLAAMTVFPVSASGKASLVGSIAFASVDGRAGFTVSGFKVLAGRLPNPSSETEILLSESAANQGHLRVGQRVSMRLFRAAVPDDPDHVRPDEGIPLVMTVTGIGIDVQAVVPVSANDVLPTLLLTPAFWKRYGIPTETAFDGVVLRLRRGTDVEAFRRTVESIAARHPESGGQALFLNRSDTQARTARAIRPQAEALVVFSVIAALASALVLGQAVSRHIALDASDYPALRSIGATRRQVVAVGMLNGLVISGIGAFIAVGVALATSPLMPIGPARIAEPHPGFAANVTLLVAGAAAIILLFGVSSMLAAAVSTVGIEPANASPSSIARTAQRAGASPVASAGIRMALKPGRGRGAVPVRSALAGTVLAVAALVASLAFASSLNRMVTDPRAFGWTWNVMLDTQFGILPTKTLHDVLDQPWVEAWAGGVYGELSLKGRAVPAIGLDQGAGRLAPTLLDGRAPLNKGEVVLGPRTLRIVGAKIGQTLDVTINALGREVSKPIPMRIVGVAVFPSIGRGTFAPTSLGDGALTTGDVLAQPELAEQQGGTAGDVYNFALVRFRGDQPAALRRLRTLMPKIPACADQECGALEANDRRPADISNYARVRATQLALAILLFALASLTVAHVLVTAVQRRRSDLAVLKTLGLTRGQVSALVAWQASTYAALACIAGVPLGVALGRWAWVTFAGELGVPASTSVPAVGVMLSVLATFVLANVAAAVPARNAARISPAMILRTE